MARVTHRGEAEEVTVVGDHGGAVLDFPCRRAALRLIVLLAWTAVAVAAASRTFPRRVA